ncbi:MAG TPA: hypothetical protein VN081_04180 [Dongiaceae bacterium]|nr:hypothetical protein [Dongiaceae bacterium]
MKFSRRFGLAAVTVLAACLVMAGSVFAADVITDKQITAIRNQCNELQANLTQLHQSDTLLRINRGQLYRTIADKLMTPLNQRIASNNLDNSTLVPLTAEFNDTYTDFYNDYKDYDQSLSAVIQIDCKKQPTQFYSALQQAREKRIKVGKSSQELTDLAVEYKKAVATFTQSLVKETKQ